MLTGVPIYDSFWPMVAALHGGPAAQRQRSGWWSMAGRRYAAASHARHALQVRCASLSNRRAYAFDTGRRDSRAPRLFLVQRRIAARAEPQEPVDLARPPLASITSR